MINVSGFKVFPNEVEDALCQHPDIIEAAVIGLPDGDGSEMVKAFVVSKNPELTADEIRKFAKGVLTAYKVPKQVEFRTDLPKTNVGKILRRELRDQELGKKDAT
jgi:long-chain acyl-CoA synthetase